MTRQQRALGDVITKSLAYQKFLRTPAAREAIATLTAPVRDAFHTMLTDIEDAQEAAVDLLHTLDIDLGMLEHGIAQHPALQAALDQHIAAIMARRAAAKVPLDD